MNYGIFLAVFLAPVIVRMALSWLINANHLQKYSNSELDAIRSAQYPGYYKSLATAITIGLIGIPLGLAVWFVVKAFNSDLLSNYLRSVFAHNAVFFNPAPGVFILALALFFMILYGVVYILTYLYLLLPARLQAYMAVMGKGSLGIKPGSEANVIQRIVDVVYVIAVLIALVALPLFSYVGVEGINHVSGYPRHKTIPLSSVRQVDINCRLSRNNNSTAVDVGITATTNNGQVSILSVSDGQLPIPFSTTNDIQAMYSLFAQQGIIVNKHGNPSCAEAAAKWWKPEAKTQYDTLFGM